MALLEVLRYPDPRLRHKAEPVAQITDNLKKLADDMLETMYAQKGIGLAAIQVSEKVRLLVIDITPQGEGDRYDLYEAMTDLEKTVKMPLVIFNPEITKKEGQTTFEEGCLSVPGFFETVERSKYIEVRGLNKKGKAVEYKLDGLISICMQHEIDHLDGKVFIDRLSPVKSNRIKAKIKKFGYPDLIETQSEKKEKQVEPT